MTLTRSWWVVGRAQIQALSKMYKRVGLLGPCYKKVGSCGHVHPCWRRCLHKRCTALLPSPSVPDPKIQVKYIDTNNQLADILTKGNFTRDEWNHLLCLINISHFSCTDCSEVMSKRTQKDSGEERVTAKSRPMMSLIARAPSTLSSSASESPGKDSCESQSPWSIGPCFATATMKESKKKRLSVTVWEPGTGGQDVGTRSSRSHTRRRTQCRTRRCDNEQ